LDAELEKATETRNWDFVRYADDISIVHYRTQKNQAIRLVIRLLKKFDLYIAREKLKTYRKYRKRILGLIVTPDSIEIPRQLRRIFRRILWKLGIKEFCILNKFSLTDAFTIIKMQDEVLTRIKGSLEAQAAGFAAYVVHAKQAAFRL
jgi:hypothetical protein